MYSVRVKFFALLLTLLYPSFAFAYIGPGAGFAFLGSGLVFLVSILASIATILFWPAQWVFRIITGKGVPKDARAKRVVIVGLDGLEPTLTEKYMDAGKLPHLSSLKENGSYSRLKTTLPSLSPVAWSSFQTGVNPGAHNIYDFLTRDKRVCLPELSSTKTSTVKRSFGFGPLKYNYTKPKIELLRKSQPFWKILGKKGIFSTVIRIPISYPPEPFKGNILSAMCTPDLRGSQGTFSFYTTRDPNRDTAEGGEFKKFKKVGDLLNGKIEGPHNPFKPTERVSVEFSLASEVKGEDVTLDIQGQKIILKEGIFSDWFSLDFYLTKRKKISGIVRFCLREKSPEVSLYISPIHINPESPAVPISAPGSFAVWFAKKIGLYGTLGLMEDTWGRNEHALDDKGFLDQAYLNHAEREVMFFEALEKTNKGVCACVFDASDRIQHMFWRYLDPMHPSPLENKEVFADTIPKMYQKMDELVGKVKSKLSKDDLLIILSDHGFASFRRGVNLNTWLYKNGYLAIKEGMPLETDYLQNVDWSKTKAFAIGLTGIFINRKGREINGIVDKTELSALKKEISEKLKLLKDPLDSSVAIREVYDSEKEYKGLYVDEAPDLIPGYSPGYRISWDSVTGGIEADIFSDNIKAWSGDHHIDPELVPGVLFTNRKLVKDNPDIVDIAPTVLDVFKVKVPAYMEGKIIL